MHEGHDRGYRLIFSHPEMVEHLLSQFVAEPWTAGLDFKTLEKMSERDIGPDLIRREKDLLWRLRWKQAPGEISWLYIFIHVEFQSRVDRFMALRELVYKVLFWENLVRQKAVPPSGKLPPVFSITLYNGVAEWTAPLSLEDLVETIPGKSLRSSILEYFLIDERSYPLEELEQLKGPVAKLFELEQSHDLKSVRRGVARLEQVLRNEDQTDLRQAFAIWLSHVLIPARTSKSVTGIPELRDLMEVKTMLEQNVLKWTEDWKAEGLEVGRKEGRREGRREERHALLTRLLEQKFGPLDSAWKTHLSRANAQQLAQWADRLLAAQSVEDIFTDTL